LKNLLRTQTGCYRCRRAKRLPCCAKYAQTLANTDKIRHDLHGGGITW